jgi:hypothetical protein
MYCRLSPSCFSLPSAGITGVYITLSFTYTFLIPLLRKVKCPANIEGSPLQKGFWTFVFKMSLRKKTMSGSSHILAGVFDLVKLDALGDYCLRIKQP